MTKKCGISDVRERVSDCEPEREPGVSKPVASDGSDLRASQNIIREGVGWARELVDERDCWVLGRVSA